MGLYFHPLLLHPTQTLFAPYSDLLAEHLPARVFLVREWRATGELPLWNPYHFCGSPVVHDIQVGVFYPPYAVTSLFPESAAGAVMSWGDGGGFLVLADVWYPGWVCRVDGAEVPVERANHACRAVQLPAGAREAVFTFEPRSDRVGWLVSAVSLAVLIVAGGVLVGRRAVAARRPAAYPIPTPSPAGPA